MNYCVPVHCDVELIVFIARGLIAIAELIVFIARGLIAIAESQESSS